MRYGKLFFALSFFCFVILIAFTVFALTGSNAEMLFSDNSENLDGWGTREANAYILIVFIMVGYALIAVIPTLIKAFEIVVCKVKIAKASIVLDVIFALIGGFITLIFALRGYPISLITLWAASATVLPLLSLFFDIKGKTRAK